MTGTDYASFLQGKARADMPTGHKVSADELNPHLFDFQRDIVSWAIQRGRACIWAECGLGKTLMQLEWARNVPGDVLILAPLAVAAQTQGEGRKFGIDVTHANDDSEVRPGINVTNYDKLGRFDLSRFTGLVLDESSILKAHTGKTRTALIEAAQSIPYRLACTATPAPNDLMELGNHAEFMGVMSQPEMLASFFLHDGGDTSKWRLRGHASAAFWRWVAGWAVILRHPSDLGFDDDRFSLPPKRTHDITIDVDFATDGALFDIGERSLLERRRARKESIDVRVQRTAELVNKSDGPWIVWCDLNAESDALVAAIDGAQSVSGSDSSEKKEATMAAFSSGELRVLVTKPSIAGWGMNWQHCSQMAFVGLSDSYEQMYQAIRRCWRFGQTQPVDVYVVTASSEGPVVQNIRRKDAASEELYRGMVEAMSEENRRNVKGSSRDVAPEVTDVATGDGWTLYLGDSCERLKNIESDSVGFSIFSPPFASLYTYSASDRDMGNCASQGEFIEHFRFLVDELMRVTMPGRLLSFHCMNLPMSKARDGAIGIKDFRGELIRAFQDAGWIFHSEVCIWKDPVTAMQRTKALGLLHKQIVKDSAMSRQGIPDYLVTMRKPGTNPVPVEGPLDVWVGDADCDPGHSGRRSINIWQRYASPVWMDINPSDTLQYRSARDADDERHICPLQLQVIRRAIELWTLPGDLVLSPFAGIGSEGHEAIAAGRRFVGCELKESYWKQAANNLRNAEVESRSGDLFAMAGSDADRG